VSGRCPPKSVAVTFDDAWRSVLERAYPILSRLETPATVFVPIDYPDRDGTMSWPGVDRWLGGPHEGEMRCLSWSELRDLADKGWEIGSHSCSHPRLTTLADDELGRQLRESRAACEREVGSPCESFAYPYGDCDERVIAATGAAGYSGAGALESKLTPGQPLRWPRIGIYRADDRRRYAFKVSRGLRLLRASAAWDAVTATRSLVAGGARRGLRHGRSRGTGAAGRVPGDG
jgi:peptidoglycan/xylan/chitin deacetylase (PgdA/CDA1 family)